MLSCSSAVRSSIGSTRFLSASSNQALISACSFSGCSLARFFDSARIGVDVVQLPHVLVEMALARDRRVQGDGLPAVLPDAARAEHRVVLPLLLRRRRRRVEAVAHRHARQRILLDAAVDLRHLQPADVEDRRDDVGAVVVLVAHLAAGLDALRPGDHQRIARAAGVFRVALEHLERRRGRRRPAGRIVLVGVRSAEPVDQLQVLRELVGIAVEELVLVHRSVRAALARRAVVGGVDDDGVLQLAGSSPGSR